MSRTDAQFRLRLPHDLLAEIKADALASGRTMNAEIVGILRNKQTPLRDWFAGQIASGMAAHSGTSGLGFGPGDIASRSYEVADAMLAAREKAGGV